MQWYPTANTINFTFRLQAEVHHICIFFFWIPLYHSLFRKEQGRLWTEEKSPSAAPLHCQQCPAVPKIEHLTSNCHVCVAQLYIASTRLKKKKLCSEHKGKDRNGAISSCFAASSAGKSFWSLQSPYPCQPLTLQMQLLFKFSPFLAWSKTELQRKHSTFILDHASSMYIAAPALLFTRYFWTSDPVTQCKIIKLQKSTCTYSPVVRARHTCRPGWARGGRALQPVQFAPAQLSQSLAPEELDQQPNAGRVLPRQLGSCLTLSSILNILD